MRKSKNQKEDRYYLLTVLLSVLSILCFEVTFFKEYQVFVMLWFGVFIFLELWISRIIAVENELKKSYLSVLISFLSIILFDMLIMTFSNQMISYVEIGKYAFVYLFCLSIFIFSCNKLYPKKKVLSNFLFIGILLSNLLLDYFIIG